MNPLSSLRNHTARVVRDFVAGGPKCACSRATVLALTALGILATGGTGSIAALLSGFGINIGASALFGFLDKLSAKGPNGPTLDDALAAVQALGEQEQRALQQIADQVDVMPMLLGEALAQHGTNCWRTSAHCSRLGAAPCPLPESRPCWSAFCSRNARFISQTRKPAMRQPDV